MDKIEFNIYYRFCILSIPVSSFADWQSYEQSSLNIIRQVYDSFDLIDEAPTNNAI